MTGKLHSRNTPADLRLSLQQTDVHAARGQQRRHGKSTNTASHNDYVVHDKDLLDYVFIQEAAQHDQHRLNSIEDEMDDE